MGIRKFIPEFFRMTLYQTEDGEYFYAWSWKSATKKHPNKKLYVINDYGHKCHVKGT